MVGSARCADRMRTPTSGVGAKRGIPTLSRTARDTGFNRAPSQSGQYVGSFVHLIRSRICRRIKGVEKMSKRDEVSEATAELVKAGMAFMSEVGSDGRTFYIIDSIALSEDDLVFLYRKRALTPQGLRHYLVDRAA